MNKHFELPKDIDEIITKMTKSAKEIGLGNFTFEYMEESDFYTVSLSETKQNWQMVVRGQFNLCDRADIYNVSFLGEIKYEYSERD
jgi:hypothetical protein